MPTQRSSFTALLLLLASCQAAGFHTTSQPIVTTGNEPTPNNPAAAEGGGNASIEMPDVHGRNRTDAEAAVRAAGLRGKIEIELEGGVGSTEVCHTVPSAGGKTRVDFTVTLTLCVPEGEGHVRPELEGLTPDAAKVLAKRSGWTGTIEIHVLGEYAKGCKDGTVCRVEPFRWELNQDRVLSLWLNKKLEISNPNE